MAAPIQFYFDLISPYSYLAWTQLPALAEKFGRAYEAKPVLLGAILTVNGTKGPAEVEARRLYTFKHVSRLAHGLGFELVPPPSHPFNPLLGLRVCCAAAELGAETQHRVIDALFTATFRTGAGIETAETIAAALRSANLDAAGLLANAAAPAVKERLRVNTEDFMRKGGFGVPTLIVDGELFFGFDAFPHVEQFLRGADPITPALVARWRDLPASARRPGT